MTEALSAILGALVGGLVTYQLGEVYERRRVLRRARFDIYMMLLELQGWYFWFSSAEMRSQPIPREARKKAWELSWRVADKLRESDRLEYLSEILEILFAPVYSSARERYAAMGKLIEKIGALANPQYRIAMKALDPDVLAGSGRDVHHPSNAPGAVDNGLF